ncbi:hypothetical protein M8J76_001687 [Diaphorina citri]|nr:hypothetical protein M8J75_001622 [Diaphorina citri]KAI5740212.1 hypothetical protein M8J76_001687 [Diaphorina citri]
MATISLTCLTVTTVSALRQSRGIYNDDYSGGSDGYRTKFPQILMHKQALGTDGTFNYAFAADNGLKQGESINPDGTRIGAYSYVDPNGQTISVKYSAGKEGFKILQGDHIPRAPVHVEQTPAVPYNPHTGASYASPGRYSSASSDEDFDYSPPSSAYRKPLSPLYHKAAGSAYSVHEDDDGDDERYNALSSKYSDYDDKGPHNFGSGYNFEFGSK